jgi:calcineurin-like phosphoesterase family protein
MMKKSPILSRKFNAITAAMLSAVLGSSLMANVMAADAATDDKVVFAVMGDMPYNDAEKAMFSLPDGKIVKAIQELNPPVLIFYGDFNKGNNSCTDSSFKELKGLMANLLPGKVIYTPGDNDWTDCDRTSMKERFDELERLAFIRNLFYSEKAAAMYKDVPNLTRQEGTVENAAWEINGLVFGTLHLPGTNDGRMEILKTDVDHALNEADRRDESNDKWLDSLFEKANAEGKHGLVVTLQADIYRPEEGVADKVCDKESRQDCDGLKRIRDKIATMAKSFNKPLLLIHGDTNGYCFNRPVSEAQNFWHFNGPGDYKLPDAAKVVFDPSNKEVPFSVAGLTDSRAYPEVCDYSR